MLLCAMAPGFRLLVWVEYCGELPSDHTSSINVAHTAMRWSSGQWNLRPALAAAVLSVMALSPRGRRPSSGRPQIIRTLMIIPGPMQAFSGRPRDQLGRLHGVVGPSRHAVEIV